MAFRKRNPGCPCCCLVWSHSFDDQDSIEDAYTVVGDVDYSESGKLTIDGDATIVSSRQISDTQQAWSMALCYDSGDFPEGATLELRLLYLDADNYAALHLTFSSGFIDAKLIEVLSGISSDLTDVKRSTWIYTCGAVLRWIDFCIDDDEITAKVRDTASDWLRGTLSDRSQLGQKHSVDGINFTSSEPVHIDEIEQSRYLDKCITCLCERFSNLQPTQINAAATGLVSDGYSPCADCDDLNVTYNLNQEASGNETCDYVDQDTPTACSLTEVSLTVSAIPNGYAVACYWTTYDVSVGATTTLAGSVDLLQSSRVTADDLDGLIIPITKPPYVGTTAQCSLAVDAEIELSVP